MSTPTIDYDALAQKHGANVDYDALAAKHGTAQINTANSGARQSDAADAGMLQPHGGPMDLMRGAGAGIKQFVTHPIDTIGGGIGSAVKNAMASGMSPIGEGYPSTASLGAGKTGREAQQGNLAIQMQAQDEAGQQGKEIKEHPYYAAGSVAGPALLTHGIAKGIGALPEGLPKIGQYIRPTPSTSIVDPSEMAARRLAQAVQPAGKDAANFIKAAPLEVPNIREYAQRTGNPLNTRLEFSKAGQGNAAEARDLYEKQVLGPNNDALKTTGTGFGDRTGEGPDTYARAADIDKRITEINKQLDKPALNVDDQRRALASKADIQREAGALRDILHKHLAERTGLEPEDIANLRQRVGRSYELGNDTEAGVTQMMQAEGKPNDGPLHLSQIPSKLLQTIRGGPTAIADRAFQKSIRNFPGQAEPLPTIRQQPPELPIPPRQSLSSQLGIEAGKPPINVQELPKSEQEAYLRKFQGNREAQQQGISQVSGAQDKAVSQHELRQQQLLAKAKERQGLSKVVPQYRGN